MTKKAALARISAHLTVFGLALLFGMAAYGVIKLMIVLFRALGSVI